jgi:hypothetical protein
VEAHGLRPLREQPRERAAPVKGLPREGGGGRSQGCIWTGSDGNTATEHGAFRILGAPLVGRAEGRAAAIIDLENVLNSTWCVKDTNAA